MVPISFIFFIFVATSVLSDDPYIPCQSYISFSYDDSSTLNDNNFKTQMNFIKNAIGSLNYPDRLRAEGGYGSEFNWKSGLSISQMQSAIDAAEQTSIPYSLLQQFSSLAISYENLNDYGSLFGAMIFISDTSDSALRNADRLFQKLKGIRLTFVLLGPNVDSRKLRNFTTNFIYWPDLFQPAPDNWDLVSFHAYGCDAPYNPTSTKPITAQSTTMFNFPTPTVSQTTGSTPSPGDYVPCQVLITTLVDISKALSIDQFQKQLTFTKNFITLINHPERIQYGAYYEGNGNMTYIWNDANTQAGLLQAIDDTKQTSYLTNLAGAMRVLSNNAPQNRTIPDSTIIFVTDTTNSIDIQSAVNLYNSLLKPRGIRLTFILVGNKTDANALSGFSDTIIFNWQNIGVTAQPVGWDLSAALRCTPLTLPPPTMNPYIPCQSRISFGVDDSNELDPNSFTKQLNFISSAIGNITHPERIAAVGMYSQPVNWNSGLTIPQIQTAVTGLQQGGYYSLRMQFAALLTNLQNTPLNNIPVGALIFISDTSNAALQGADQFLPQLTNVRITFVLLGYYVNQSKLTKYSSNFITWRDLSQLQPDNWNNLYGPAYGCQ